jgi:transposase
MDRARYAVDAVVLEGRSLRSVASSLDMSKSWVAKQVTRFHAGGYQALVPRSKAPHRRPSQTPAGLENEIVTLRKHLDEEGLDAGPLTIQYHLRQRHGVAPGRSTIHRVLVRRRVRHPPTPEAAADVLDTVRVVPAQRDLAGRHDPLGTGRRDECGDPRLRRRLLPHGDGRRRGAGHDHGRRGRHLLPGGIDLGVPRLDAHG